ncbi:unnamed protein product [Staurois parvus]|uniref:Uncharacterized protein n=1 Tax=Staurois parvus TaxID=386267 RepID=A0ABN9E591_9NEOB|nr:unnamed protein product [Staurois parvus]
MAKNSLRIRKKRIVALHKNGLDYNCQDPETELQHGGQDHTAVQQDRFHSEQASPWLTKEVECTCSTSYPQVVFGK